MRGGALQGSGPAEDRDGHNKNARRNHSLGAPSPPMQAPASSKSRSVGPSGQDLLYDAKRPGRYGVINEFEGSPPNRTKLSTARQHSDPGRSRGGAWSGAGRPRSAHRRVGPTKTPEGTSGSAPSPQMQAPAASRLRSVGPSGQDLLYPVGAALDQRLIHEFQSSLVHPKHVVHAHSTGLCPNTPVPWSPRRPRISRLQAPTERRQSAGRPGRSRARPRGPEPRHCRRGRRASRTRSGVEIVGARQSPQDSR
jgi:hypothetical protein